MSTVIARTTLGVVVPYTIELGNGVRTVSSIERAMAIQHAQWTVGRIQDVAGVQIDLTIVEPTIFTAKIALDRSAAWRDVAAVQAEFNRVGLADKECRILLSPWFDVKTDVPNDGIGFMYAELKSGMVFNTTNSALVAANYNFSAWGNFPNSQGATMAHEWLHSIEQRLRDAGYHVGFGLDVPAVHDGATSNGGHASEYPENTIDRHEWQYLKDLMTAKVPKPGGGTYGITTNLWRAALTPIYAPTVAPIFIHGGGTHAVGRMTATLAIVDSGNGFVRDISDQLIRGTVTMNEDLRIPLAFSATLRDPSVVRPQIDYLAPRLRVAWDDGSVVDSQVGQYAVLPPSEQRHRWPGTEATIDARDMTWKVDAYAFDRTFTVAAGTDVVDAVINILAYAGLSRHRLVTGRARLTEPRSFTAGTPALDMVNELLSGIGWYRLWPDSTGVLTSRAYQDTADAEPVVTYRSGPGTELMTDTIVEKSPGAPAVNRIVVIKDTFSSTDASPIIAIRTNTNPASPTSTVATGTLVSRTVRDSTLVDQAAADALADRLLREAGGRYRVLTLKTLTDPRRGMHESALLDIKNRANQTIAEGNWRCRTWELGFTPSDGLMTIELNTTEAI